MCRCYLIKVNYHIFTISLFNLFLHTLGQELILSFLQVYSWMPFSTGAWIGPFGLVLQGLFWFLTIPRNLVFKKLPGFFTGREKFRLFWDLGSPSCSKQAFGTSIQFTQDLGLLDHPGYPGYQERTFRNRPWVQILAFSQAPILFWGFQEGPFLGVPNPSSLKQVQSFWNWGNWGSRPKFFSFGLFSNQGILPKLGFLALRKLGGN